MITEYNLTISANLMPIFHAMPARSPSYFVKNLLSVFNHPKCVGYGHRKHGCSFTKNLSSDSFAQNIAFLPILLLIRSLSRRNDYQHVLRCAHFIA
jgi:hypothetical protein